MAKIALLFLTLAFSFDPLTHDTLGWLGCGIWLGIGIAPLIKRLDEPASA